MASNTRDEIIKYIFDAVGGEKIDQIKDSIQKTGEESQKSGTFIGEFEKKLAEIVSIAAAVEVALKGIEWGKDQLKGAEDVEASLSRVKALAGDAAGQFGELEEAVQKAATAVNVSSQESATGLAALVNQGLSAKTAIEALIPTLQLAKIANIDVGTAAAEVAESLKAFNLPASDAQKVVDELTAASHGAAGGLAAMSSAAVALAPDAKTLGLNFGDVVSVLGLLASKGLDTEKSVRGLRTVFQELENPTSSLRGQLLALGDGTNDFGAAIAALTSGTPRANEALLTLNGPARSLVETLGQAGPGAIAAFNAKLQESQGIAARTAAVLDDNLRGAATRFENAISTIGEKLAKPILEPFAKELEKLAGELNAWAESDDFKDIEAAAVEMATEAAKAIDQFLHSIDWKTFGKNGKEAIQGLADDLKALADSATTVATAVGKTADFIGVAYHGLGIVVDGVVAGAAKGADGLVTLAEKAGNLTGTSKALTDQTEGLHAALQSVGDIAATNAGAHFEKFTGDVEDLAGASEKAATATTAHGAAAAEAAPKVEQHAAASQHAAEATHAAATELPTMVVSLRDTTAATGSFADALAAGANKLSEFKDKSGKAVDGLEAVKTAMNLLHVQSQQQLQEDAIKFQTYFNTIDKYSAQTAAGLADRQNAFLAYAQASLAATAQADEGTRQSIQYQLEQKAAVLGVTDALADLEKQSGSSHAALVSDANRGADALNKEFEAADRLSGKLHGGNGSVSDSANQAGGAVDDFAARGSSSLEQLGNYMASTRAGFAQISDAAAKAFDKRVLQDFNGEFDATGIGFAKVIGAIGDAAQQTTDEIAAARAQLQGMIDATAKIGTESVDDFNKFGGVAKYSESQLEGLISAIQSGNYEAGLLGQQELQPLLAALQAAKQRVDALKAASEAAKQGLADMASQLQDDIDNANGNQEAVEDRRYQQQLANLQAQAKAAGELNSAVYQQAVANANALHALNMKNIADQAAAAKSSNSGSGGGGAGSSAGGPARTSAGSSSQPTTVSAPTNVTAALHPVTLHFGDALQLQLYGSPDQITSAQALVEQIARARQSSINGRRGGGL